MANRKKKRNGAIIGIMAIALAIACAISYISISLYKGTWSPLEWTSQSWESSMNVNVGDNNDSSDNPDTPETPGIKNYAIDFAFEGGSVNLVDYDCPSKSAARELVEFDIYANSDFVLIGDIFIVDTDTQEVLEFIGNGDGAYSFTMYAKSVTVKVVLTEKHVNKTPLNATLWVSDHAITSDACAWTLVKYSGELNEYNVKFNFYTETEADYANNKFDMATLSIGGLNERIFKAGQTYLISVENNGGYFWENNFGWAATDGLGLYYSTFEFKEGVVAFTPQADVYCIYVQLLRYPVSENGYVDFNITVSEINN